MSSKLKPDEFSRKHRKYLIAIENEKVVGYLAYKIKEKHSKKLHVDQIIVSEVNRRKGILLIASGD